MPDVTVGSLVVHRNRPDWGPGKVFGLCDGYVLVGFRDVLGPEKVKRLSRAPMLLASAPAQSDAQLDGWKVQATADCRVDQTAVAGAKKASRPRPPLVAEMTLEQALDRFRATYPDGFAGPAYCRAERDWKWEKHEEWLSHFSGHALRDMAGHDPIGAGRLVMSVIQATAAPLLHPKGQVSALTHGLEEEGSTRRFLEALADYLDANPFDATRFKALVDALASLPVARAGARLGSWPNLTVVPFLAQPDRHMFLKPDPTKAFARLLGEDLRYSPSLRADTYQRLMDLSARVLEFLRPHGARDFIDVQSFMWIVARG